MEKFYSIWKKTFCCGDGYNFHYKFTQGSQKFISFLNPKTPAQLRPLTVVLHGPAGVGKTTLAKKVMLDWTQDNLPETRSSALYLSCKELNHKEACTFAELMSKNWPDLQEAGPEILAQAQKVLIIIDGFDELRAPSGSLIHDICGDWKKQKPVSVLLGSLLKRKMLPKATLLITTRPGALRELRPLLEQPLLVEIEGLSELDRREYFLKYFQEEHQALRAFDLMKSNPALFHMGSAPAVCWIVCTCLKLQMEKREDPAPTCQTTTSLFLRFLCCQFTQAPGSCPSHGLAAPVKALCVLAAEGLWTQASVFNGEDLGRLGVEEPDLRPFLDKNIIQKDRDCGGCYSFIHLSVQQLLAAMFYVLDSEEEEDGESHRRDIGDIQKLLSKEERLKNPNLTHVVYFLFGLTNEKRARELETTFSCQVSLGIKQELLKLKSGGNKPLSSMMDMKEVVYCLYESQEEQLVRDAMVQVKEMSLHLKNQMDIVYSSFCLKHCQNLQKISLQVEKGIFLENDTVSESDTWVQRSQHDHHALCLWTDLCSVFSSNKNLSFLDVVQSFLSYSSMRILCEQITRVTCHLQKVVIKNISPAEAYQDFCLALTGKKTLTHLILEGNVHSEKMLLLLCETLKNLRCNLQYLRLGSCSDITQQWDNFSLALETNQSLKCLDLMACELLDEGVRLLCTTLRHPKCFLQRLSLENCHLTEACCKELSYALIVNQRLTHLCLAKNNLGDGGVKLLCEGLSYPECQLQTLVFHSLSCYDAMLGTEGCQSRLQTHLPEWATLCHCSITRRGCKHISKLLQGDSSLTHLDLGLNPIASGLWFLCEALKKSNCNLKYLGLCGCSITSFYCQDLASALTSNQRLETLDLEENSLGKSGIMVLFEALKQNNGPLKTFRMKMDESSVEIQKMLREVKDSNPKLTIDCKDSRTGRSLYCDFFS